MILERLRSQYGDLVSEHSAAHHSASAAGGGAAPHNALFDECQLGKTQMLYRHTQRDALEATTY